MRNEFFIRYYISESAKCVDLQIGNILAKLPQLHGWLRTPIGRFNYEKSRGFLPGPNQIEIVYARRKCVSVIEHQDPIRVIGKSLIWTYGKRSPATLIDDLLALCSIAISNYIYSRIVETLLPGDNLHITHSPVAPLGDLKEVIPLADLEVFVSSSFNKLQQKEWKHKVGVIPAIYWYRQAQQTFHAGIFPLHISLYWVVLEILAAAYVQNQGLAKITKKKERVKKFISSLGFVSGSWSFIELAIDDWYQVRCASLHEGKLPRWTETKFEQRWRQLAEFVSFVLASLLQKQDQTWENQVAKRISAY